MGKDSTKNLVYFDSAFVAQCHQRIFQKRKGIFHCSDVGTDTLNKSFGLDLGSNRRQAVLQKIGKTQK
jgi:hypothetical protein